MDAAENVRFINHQGGTTGPVVVQGNFAFTAFYSELAVLDISDPHQPVRVGYVVLQGEISQLCVYENTVIAATYQTLYIIDVSDPSSPVQVGHFTYNGYALGLAANRAYLFLSESLSTHYPGGIHIFDYTDPTDPVQVGYYKTPGEAASLFVKGEFLYVAERGDYEPIPKYWGGLRILDISDPSAPVEKSYSVTARFAEDVVVIDNLAYVVDRFSGLWIMDVSDPSSPLVLGQIPLGGYSEDLAVVDGYAYVTNRDLGLLVTDVHDPEHPQHLGTYISEHWNVEGSGVAAVAGYVYLGGSLSALHIIDVSDPFEPVLANRFGGPGMVYDMDVSGDNLYVADWGMGLWVIDISDPRMILVSGVYEDWSASEVAVRGNNAYLYDGWLHVLDIANPRNIIEISSFDSGVPVGDMVILDNTLYLVPDQSVGGFYLVDVSDPSHLALVGSAPITGTIAVAVNDDYAFVTGWSGIHILDTSDPANILQVGYHPQGGNDLEVVGKLIYQAAFYCDDIDCYSGLQVVDISDPTNPNEVSFTVVDSIAYRIAVSDSLVYLYGLSFEKGDGTIIPDELHVYNVSDAYQPEEVGYLQLRRAEIFAEMTVHSGYTYTGGNGLTVLQYGSTASGYIRDLHGAPVAGVEVSAGDSFDTVTGFDGGYFLPELPPGVYNILPTLLGYAFYPSSRLVQTPPDASGANFTLLPTPVSATIFPQVAGSLVYTDTQGLPTTFDIPPGGVAVTSTLTVTPTLAYGAGGNAFAGHAFELDLSPVGVFNQSVNFNLPVTVTIQYSLVDVDVVSDVDLLGLYWWDGAAWIHAQDTCQPDASADHDKLARQLAVGICSTGKYALFGPTNAVYLPYAGREP